MQSQINRTLTLGLAVCADLTQNGFHYVPVDICESHIATGETKREFGVIDTKQVEHSGMEVVDGYFILDGFIAVFVGGSISQTAFDASPR